MYPASNHFFPLLPWLPCPSTILSLQDYHNGLQTDFFCFHLLLYFPHNRKSKPDTIWVRSYHAPFQNSVMVFDLSQSKNQSIYNGLKILYNMACSPPPTNPSLTLAWMHFLFLRHARHVPDLGSLHLLFPPLITLFLCHPHDLLPCLHYTNVISLRFFPDAYSKLQCHHLYYLTHMHAYTYK